ncbi:Polyprenol-phosphate-mannose-dependent alpha-(1-2)-phosphatidylinositol pentamannoside mannosyltransferase [Pirellulimonas nuda]|uniref:Polyprenol-phosphate-mannose-dependent alpha-(1-2)-phosphatidylinositol pentamannoside mannosyltransferase n=1 Tax=Pirellulimonas nuda TaxID=2528009 RepID=A0A518D5D8_9BACT|nr:glycosyltransferase family 87 protein [Pirellulimonas nuda]QDU86684.1 Polyprenol-phosphate-mannose-dependent alpha-(1-2)-phosphatidylinositol pentamannoside mannosyltransferase [Pirellulimonas nuda]
MLATPLITLADSIALESLRSKHVLWLVAVIPLGAALAATMYRDRFGRSAERSGVLLAGAMCAAFVLLDAGIIASNVRSPREWDFKHFWTWGVAVAQGTSPYDHENLLRIAEPLSPSPELRRELYCFYPPPSLLLFAPLGWAPFGWALLLWNLVQAAALAACLALFRSLFVRDARIDSYLPLAAMVLAFWSTSATFVFSQTNFLVLLSILLFWRDRTRARAGVWLALGVLVKPLAASLGLYLLLRARWSALAAAAGTLALVTALTTILLGPEIFSQFLQHEGISEQYLLAQTINQSLSGELLRATGLDATASTLLDGPIVLAATLLLTAATAVVIWRTRSEGDAYAVGATLAMMLLIYPGTLTHYGVHLLPALALLWSNSSDSQPGDDLRPLALTTILAAFALASLRMTFWATVIVWLVMAVQGLRRSQASAVAFQPRLPVT